MVSREDSGLFLIQGYAMSDAHHEHQEDNSVNVKIAIFFVVVIAVITFIGLIN
jgi:hypothetical protein